MKLRPLRQKLAYINLLLIPFLPGNCITEPSLDRGIIGMIRREYARESETFQRNVRYFSDLDERIKELSTQRRSFGPTGRER